ncbi:hypothetical protein BRARA_F01602 [Brassica rapa]|uniref:F-box domain-containing protein n=1 Tax=Brassica campestris TaxID=3711 RepID=A0A397Z548_BRACM|nr:hypothetical protein BRARA_F01602 [Brassica rapa]
MAEKQKQCVSKEETRIISSTTSTKASRVNSGQITMDIILEILSRVPAKSIARFRCVSKDWGVSLCRPYFTDLFLKMSSLSPCLLFTFQTEDARMMICNPSTGGFNLLPKVKTRMKTRRRRVLTYLEYDPVEKVYKVLCMTSCEKPFRTGNMKWRMIECSVSHCPESKDNEICIDGVLYYLAVGSGSWETSMTMIVCFDIRSEKFKFIVDEAFKDINYPSSLINYKGNLGPPLDGRFSGFVLWVIDDIENHIWCKNIIMLPSLWWSLVAGTRFHIVGTTVEIQGLGHVKGQKIYTFLNRTENVKLITQVL